MSTMLPVENCNATESVIAAPIGKSVSEVVEQPASSHLRDLLDLLKPRISAMVLVTVALSHFVASQGHPDLWNLLHTLIGTLLVAASSGAFSQWLEQHTDGCMERTSDRPLPAGRMGTAEVIAFGVITLIAGVTYLSLTVNWQAVLWAVATWVVYVCVYTPMKTWTSWNTTVGAISGALPILIGSSAVGQTANLHVWAMLTVLFVWQFPHFLAIAWLYRHQYASAGLQMVTTTDPTGKKAGLYSVLGAMVVIACSLLPLLSVRLDGFNVQSGIYGIIAVSLGIYQLIAAAKFRQSLNDRTARQLLKASIIYLPLALGLIAVHTAL